MRRYGLLFALIPAILAASLGLAYYSYTRTETDRRLVMETLAELAEEKVLGVESEITKAEQQLLASFEFDTRSKLKELLSRSLFENAFLLDYNGKVVNGGTYSRTDAVAARAFLEKRVLPDLDLEAGKVGERRRLHGTYDGRPRLFSYVRRFSPTSGQIYFVVLETDLDHLVGDVFPEFFGLPSKKIYQVVDENGTLVFKGASFAGVSPSSIVEQNFPRTLRRWKLRVTQRDRAMLASYETRQVVDAALIGLALAIIIGGLIFLVFAVRRERRLSRLKSDFISNVSHELKTPLSIISMFGEMLATGRTKSPEQATEYAEIIRRESVRLARLIDNVLDFAKIERGAHVYEFAEGDIADVVSRVMEICKHRLDRANLEIELDLDDIPELSIDENALTLALLNLIDNAIKYAPDGKRLRLAVSQTDDRVILEVRDWGPGIAQDEQEQVFERFYRAKSVRLKPIRGSGIGLALVKHVAVAHGGDIDVDSRPGEGTTFRLWIPKPNAA